MHFANNIVGRAPQEVTVELIQTVGNRFREGMGISLRDMGGDGGVNGLDEGVATRHSHAIFGPTSQIGMDLICQ